MAHRRKSRKELQNKIERLSRLYYGVSQDTIHWKIHDAFVLLIEMELSISQHETTNDLFALQLKREVLKNGLFTVRLTVKGGRPPPRP